MGTKSTTATGTTIKVGAWTAQWTTFDEADIHAREAVEITSSASDDPGPGEHGGREYKPGGRADPGTLTIETIWDEDNPAPVNGPVDDVVITFPLASGYATPSVLAGKGFIISATRAGEDQAGEITQSVVIKKSGVWSFTPRQIAD